MNKTIFQNYTHRTLTTRWKYGPTEHAERKPDNVQAIPAPRCPERLLLAGFQRRVASLTRFRASSRPETCCEVGGWDNSNSVPVSIRDEQRKTSKASSRFPNQSTGKPPQDNFIFTEVDFCAHARLCRRRSKTRKTETITGLTFDTRLTSDTRCYLSALAPRDSVISDSNYESNHIKPHSTVVQSVASVD